MATKSRSKSKDPYEGKYSDSLPASAAASSSSSSLAPQRYVEMRSDLDELDRMKDDVLHREGKVAGGLRAPLVAAPRWQEEERESFSAIPMGVAIHDDEGKAADVDGLSFTADFGFRGGARQEEPTPGYQALSEGPSLYPSMPAVAPPPVAGLAPMGGSLGDQQRAALHNVKAAAEFAGTRAAVPVAQGMPMAQGVMLAQGVPMAGAKMVHVGGGGGGEWDWGSLSCA